MFLQDQEIFNLLLNAISQGVIIVDGQQKIMEVNDAVEYFFGYPKKELMGKSLSMLIPGKYRKIYTSIFFSLQKKGMTLKGDAATRDVYGAHKNNGAFPIEIELHPFTIYNKSYVMVIVKDLTEKKKIDKILMLKSLALQSASNGILITNALKDDNPVIYCNSGFEELTGYTEAETLNKNCRFLQGKDTEQEGIIILRNAIEKGESVDVTIRNYKKDGTLFWNNLFLTPIRNSEGVVTNFIGIQNDITKQKQDEAEKHHLASILNESLNEIYVFDSKSLKFLNANYGAQKNTGFTLAELKTMTPMDLSLNDDESDFRNTIEVLFNNQNVEKIEFETITKRKDGSTYPTEVYLQLSNLGNKEVFVAINLDVSYRKNYTSKLENEVKVRTQQLQKALSKEKELNDLKTKFLSLVSHEFKTPLSGVLTSATLLSKYKLTEDQEKRDRHIKIINDKVHYLNNILNDFLSVEKLETGQVTYKINTFKLSKVVNEVVYSCNMLLKEGQKINYPENIDNFTLHQDEKVIELILFNLVYNALKYSPEYTKIDIEIAQDKNTTKFKIKDEGIGIPLDDQKNIFKRYFRAENVLSTHGTGIGLNIVKSHLENLQGSVYFESQENVGTTFIVTIPNKAAL